ncbi:MAG: CHAT domain-containing tetratricopeptide repeat protein [Acidobacteriota bacterium]
MAQTHKNVTSLTSGCLALILCLGLTAFAQPPTQTKSEADPRLQFVEFVMSAYRAYERKDREALLSIWSATSPHIAEFTNIIDEQFALAADVKLELKRVLILKATVHDDRAEVRVLSNFVGTDANGRRAEAIPREWDHTLHLIRQNNIWKLWRFTDSGEALAEAYLKATTERQRADLLVEAQPITNGFTKALLAEGQSLLEARGDDVNAEVIFQLASRLAVDNKNIVEEAGAQVGMGDVYLSRGDYVRAAENYQKVLTLVEKFHSKEGIAAISVKMGNVHYEQGNLPQAMDHYLKSARLYEELGSTIEITYPLVNLGSGYFALGNYDQALEHYQKIYKIYEKLLAKNGTAWLLNKIADVYAAQGKRDLARANYNQALKAHEELGNRALQAYALNGLGRIHFGEGNYREAIALFARAIVLARASNAPEILWKALNLLGQSHRLLRDSAQARQAFTESIAVVEQLRNQVAGTEHDQELSFGNKTAPYLGMVELLIEQGNFPEALTYAERSKGRMLLDVLRNGRADITQSLTAEERDKERSLDAAMISLSSQIRRESSLPRPDLTKIANIEDRLRQARLDYESYETRLYAAHPELRTQRGETHQLTLEEVGRLITDDHTALLEYVVAPQKTYLFVLTRKNQSAAGAAENGSGSGADLALKVYSIPIAASELTRRVAAFRETLARNSPAFKGSARELHDLLLLPAQPELAGKTTVCIVPSSQLWELPFQALVSPAGKYVIEDHALFYVPSLSVLREVREKNLTRRMTGNTEGGSKELSLPKVSTASATPVATLLAMGNPSLSTQLVSKTTATDRSISLGELPEAEREVKALGEIYGSEQSRILTGTAAGEGIFKAEAGNYTILHFATHGILDNDNPLYSRLLLASSNQNDDGYLEAREIMRLNLHADLAVLSACQTGLGRVSDGEGLIGMSWALFIAGTSTTVTSQWKVDSASTARLMVNFHRLLQGSKDQSGLRKAEALRQASIKLMAEPKYRHPFFWSGFVVVGEGM